MVVVGEAGRTLSNASISSVNLYRPLRRLHRERIGGSMRVEMYRRERKGGERKKPKNP